MLSIKERTEVVILMARYQSCIQVRRELRKKKMPNIPTDKAIRSIYNKFIESGTVHDLPRSGRPVSSVTTENAKIVHDLIEEQNQFLSITGISDIIGISRGSAHTILRKELHCFPYKIQCYQKFFEEDFQNRQFTFN